MPTAKPKSISDYIQNAPPAGLPHLTRIYEILREIAPEAEEIIKWNTPFFIEPRFLFSFSACKGHLNFAPGEDALVHFQDELAAMRTTRNYLQVNYTSPLPEEIIRKIAEHRVAVVKTRSDDSFW